MRDTNALPKRLRTLLAEHELSQAELARRTGIGRSTLNKIINGKQYPNAKQLGAMAFELDVDVLELLRAAGELAEQEAQARRLEEAEASISRAERARELAIGQKAELEERYAARVSELRDSS